MTKKLFVGNLPDGCTKEELGDQFKKYGKVAECDVIQNKNFGFVHMSSDREAQDAVTHLDSSQFMGNVIMVQFSTTDVHRAPGVGSKGECFKCGSKGHLSRDCDRAPSGRGYGRGGRGGRGGGRGYQDRGPPPHNGYREDRGRPIRRDPPRTYREPAYADHYLRESLRRPHPRDMPERRYADDPYSSRSRMALSAREYELLYRPRSRSPIRGDDYRRPLYSSRSDVYDRLYSSRSASFYDMPPRSRVAGGSRAPMSRYR